jgi:D-alanyl-D-alanine carboxypeptidase
MNHSYCFSKGKTQKLVYGHRNKNNSFIVKDPASTQINSSSIPADGIITSAQDLVIWDQNLHNGKILKNEIYKLLTSYSVKAQHAVFGKVNVAYGYGIKINDKEKPNFLDHTGPGDGFAFVNLYFPRSDACVILLENQTNETFEINYYFGIEIKKIVMNSSLTQISEMGFTCRIKMLNKTWTR